MDSFWQSDKSRTINIGQSQIKIWATSSQLFAEGPLCDAVSTDVRRFRISSALAPKAEGMMLLHMWITGAEIWPNLVQFSDTLKQGKSERFWKPSSRDGSKDWATSPLRPVAVEKAWGHTTNTWEQKGFVPSCHVGGRGITATWNGKKHKNGDVTSYD